MKLGSISTFLITAISVASAREYHVSITGNDTYRGTTAKPLRTISAAARLAQPGDVITVHKGVYRERINPLRSGSSARKRITYQAAPGEEVVLKGSEILKNWEKVQNDTWKATIPNGFFGDFNPYRDVIRGDWFSSKGREHHTGAVYLNGHWLVEAAKLEEVLKPASDVAVGDAQSKPADRLLWFAQVDENNTTIWAQFKGVNPNAAEVEINVRRTVFYPQNTGVNFITVRGFKMMHAATPWAPPTAEQIGLIGTHWSKGWIIENNDIRYSTCVGITLGKHGDEFDNTSQATAVGYVKTIERAVARGWAKERIGDHLVRSNLVAFCEQAGIVGSLGAIFSSITDNDIHDIHVRQLFSGAEMAGIKIHAAIDTEISRNRIHRTCLGLWLDWMTQGTRVIGNLFHDNMPKNFGDMLVEVSHGPYLIENNLFLSQGAVFDESQGGAYAHNLFAGRFLIWTELKRDTPFHQPHSTEVAGLKNIPGGDNRFFNNLFVNPDGLSGYDKAALPMRMGGNLFLKGALPGKDEVDPLVAKDFDPGIKLVEERDGVYLHITLDQAWAARRSRQLVTTELLGKAVVPNLPFEKPDGSPYRLDTDYFGKKRTAANPFPGPFEIPGGGKQVLKVWPVAQR